MKYLPLCYIRAITAFNIHRKSYLSCSPYGLFFLCRVIWLFRLIILFSRCNKKHTDRKNLRKSSGSVRSKRFCAFFSDCCILLSGFLPGKNTIRITSKQIAVYDGYKYFTR
jgi:hypothetical protein